MESTQQIIEEVQDESKSLVTSFLKTKVFASRIQNQALLEWVQNELMGYDDDSVPDYRIIPCRIVGTLESFNRIIQNTSIPLMHLDENVRKNLLNVKFTNGLANLVSLANGSDTASLSSNISPEGCSIIGHNWPSDYLLIEARKEMSVSQIKEILVVIRSKLLDFFLALDNRFPSEDQARTPQGQNEVRRLVNNTISGNNNIILIGDNSSHHASLSIQNDWDSLSKLLRESGLSQEDTEELHEAINADKGWGDKVKEWTITMCGKAVKGVWKIGLPIGSKLLTDYLSSYFGLNPPESHTD